MDLGQLRIDLVAGRIRLDVSAHARIEALKDGLLPEDLEQAVEQGEIVEEYPDRDRVLLLDDSGAERLPCHLVLEYAQGESYATVVTAYVPESAVWHPGYRTRKAR